MPKLVPKEEPDFWPLFEKYSAQNYDHLPNIIVNILKKSGYDNASSLGALNQDEHIHEIEEYITENHLEWVKEDSAYKDITNIFRFLPGHKIFLKILPSKVKDFQYHFSKKNKKNIGQFDTSEPKQQPRQQQCDIRRDY